MWCLKAKKNSNSYCSSEGRNRSNPKKSSYSAKKVRLGFRAFRTCFWEVDHPLCDVWNILIGVQVFEKAKIYKPTWTQNHPSAFGRRMVLCPALEKSDPVDLTASKKWSWSQNFVNPGPPQAEWPHHLPTWTQGCHDILHITLLCYFSQKP